MGRTLREFVGNVKGEFPGQLDLCLNYCMKNLNLNLPTNLFCSYEAPLYPSTCIAVVVGEPLGGWS